MITPRKSRFGTTQLFFVVDPEFAEQVSAVRWSKTHFGYLESVDPETGKLIKLHRFVWRLKHGWFPKKLDHINRLKWDCRLQNLRPATQSLNSRNRDPRDRPYPVGVRVRRNVVAATKRKYEARITIYRKQFWLGSYETPEEAAAAYSIARDEAYRNEVSKATKEAVMHSLNSKMPGDNEYLAAVAGLGEQTPSPAAKRVYAIGDFVSGMSGGKRWQGRIWNVEGDRLSIEIDGGWLAVSAHDVTH